VRIITRVIKADPQRPTRFHDLRGHPLDWASLPGIPAAICDAALHVTLGYRRHVPWLSYRATRTLGRLIQRDWRVIEFGAGMSTVWFAKRAAFVFSVESNSMWHKSVTSMLAECKLTNVDLRLRQGGCTDYTDLSELEDASCDLALIDGDCRDKCVAPTLRKLKPGGYVYLDNTDQPGDRQVAESRLLGASLEWRRYFNDFAPGLVAATQGLLVRLSL
jgi:hypothetical protein